jgi:PKD repeat protein
LTGNSFVFTNTSTGGNTYLWRFGNGATATTQNATYSYAAAGSYVVRLIVTSAAGCQDSTSSTVTVTAPPPPPPPAAGNLYVAGTTCAQFNGRTASALTRLCYTVRTTPATRRNPAVTSVSAVTPTSFMYYVRVTAPSSSFTVNIGQVVDRAGFKLFTVNTGGSVASGDNCVRVASVTTPSTGQARVSISRATTGRTYIIGVRYNTSPLVGYVTNGTLTANYTFSAKIGTQTLANSTSSVTLYPNNCASAPASIISSRMPDSKEIKGNSNNTINSTSTSTKSLSITNLSLKAYPNPTSHYFNVVVEGGSPQTEGVLRVMNMVGQLIEEKKQVKPGQLIQLGHQYIDGMYLIEYIQGTNRATLKVNKH